MGKTLPTINIINPINSMEVINLMNRMREPSLGNHLTAMNRQSAIGNEIINNVIQIRYGRKHYMDGLKEKTEILPEPLNIRPLVYLHF